MIKTLPSVINLPNYPIIIEFTDKKEEGSPDFGEVTFKNFHIKISDVNEIFNKYLYCTFLSYAVANAYDINFNSNKAHIFGMFMYHILQHNNIKSIFTSFKKKKSFTTFDVSVPSFELIVSSHNEEELPLGIITISKRAIQIYENCDPELKSVIFMHELVEWANAMYQLKMKHMEIQTMAEGLVYILNTNKFTS